MRATKQVQTLTRQLFRLSFDEAGRFDASRVTGVLQYLEKHPPASPVAVLKTYHRLVAAEVARGQAVVEHAGPVADSVLASIAAQMSKRYGRPVNAVAKPAPELLAGLRVRVGDDVYESSVAGQLAALATSA